MTIRQLAADKADHQRDGSQDTGSFDVRNKQVSLVVTQLLDGAGVSWGILGKAEKCCGESVRRLGNQYLFDQMTQENSTPLAAGD